MTGLDSVQLATSVDYRLQRTLCRYAGRLGFRSSDQVAHLLLSLTFQLLWHGEDESQGELLPGRLVLTAVAAKT
jgi:hypothetical protein